MYYVGIVNKMLHTAAVILNGESLYYRILGNYSYIIQAHQFYL